MGLRKRPWWRRQWYIWSWRWRHWWLDTREGLITRLALMTLFGLVALGSLIRTIMISVYTLEQASNPALRATYGAEIIIYIIIVLLSVAISLAMRPKTKPPAATEAEAPTVEDGQPVRDCFGDCWIDEEFLLAWKVVGRDKIRTKGGKK